MTLARWSLALVMVAVVLVAPLGVAQTPPPDRPDRVEITGWGQPLSLSAGDYAYSIVYMSRTDDGGFYVNMNGLTDVSIYDHQNFGGGPVGVKLGCLSDNLVPLTVGLTAKVWAYSAASFQVTEDIKTIKVSIVNDMRGFFNGIDLGIPMSVSPSGPSVGVPELLPGIVPRCWTSYVVSDAPCWPGALQDYEDYRLFFLGDNATARMLPTSELDLRPGESELWGAKTRMKRKQTYQVTLPETPDAGDYVTLYFCAEAAISCKCGYVDALIDFCRDAEEDRRMAEPFLTLIDITPEP